MRHPYENIYLGNFIFTLGYIASSKNIPLNQMGMQLLQQTPDDRTVGDLFANFKGKNIIFEFKRNEKEVKTEFLKPQRHSLIEWLRGSSKESEVDRALSQKGHFMCFPTAGMQVTLLFLPYALIKNETTQNHDKCKPLDSFCEILLHEEVGLGLSFAELERYFKLLKELDGNRGAVDGGAGVIMNIAKDGKINVVEFADLMILSKKLELQNEARKPTVSPALKIESPRPKGPGMRF
jgi:hypothetical protein